MLCPRKIASKVTIGTQTASVRTVSLVSRAELSHRLAGSEACTRTIGTQTIPQPQSPMSEASSLRSLSWPEGVQLEDSWPEVDTNFFT